MSQQQRKSLENKERVTGIGGIFFKAKDPGKLMEWYNEYLGVKPASEAENSSMFPFREEDDPKKVG